MARETDSGRVKQRAGAVVAIAVAFNAALLWPETLAAHRFSDEPAHVSWVQWAAERIAAGHSPLDGWLPQLALGAPQFHQYEVLPHILAGFVATLSDPATVVRWSLFLLVATWPIAVYAGARLLDRDRRVAALAALLAPLVASTTGFGLEWSSYVFRGSGLWAQAFGMWLIPLAMGYTWRAVDRGRGFALAAVFVAATLCCHFFWGYIALIWVGVVVLAGPRSFLRRLGRGALVVVGGILASAWLLVPLAVDMRWVGSTQFKNRSQFDSSGARSVLEWLFTGKLLDFDRPFAPIVTALALIGAAVCVARFRRDPSDRVILTFTVLCLVLFFGRPTLAGVVDVIPGLRELPLHRFVGPVQLGALLLAGIGGSTLIDGVVRWVRGWEPRPRTVALVIASVVGATLLVPAIVERTRYADANATLIRAQQSADRDDGAAFADLVALASRRGRGRIFAGNVTGAGVNFRVGQVPAYEEILNDDGMGLGFGGRVASISVDTELGFDPDRLDHYALFGVHYLILPSVGTPTVPATLLRTRGAYSLFEVGPGGYLRIADSVGPPIAADRATLGARTAGFLASQLPALDGTQPIAFDGDAPARPTASLANRPSGSPGAVRRETDRPNDGEFRGTVNMQRRAVVVLAASYHARWTATVDGKPVKTQMVAPSFVAVTVPAGVHNVAFRYEPYPNTSYALLIALGIFAIGSLALIDRRTRRSRRSGEPA